jgi:hypothetical protein
MRNKENDLESRDREIYLKDRDISAGKPLSRISAKH